MALCSDLSSFNWSLNATPANGSNINFNVYDGILSSVYTDTGNDTNNLTLLWNVALRTQTGSTTITNTFTFQYVVSLIQDLTSTNSSYSGSGFWVRQAPGGHVGTKSYTISTDATTGYPSIDPSLSRTLTYNVDAVSGVANDQLLIDTANSLNKWTPY